MRSVRAVGSLRYLIVAALAVLALPGTGACQSNLTRTLTHDGIERTYQLHLPAATAAKLPLIVALHGIEQTIRQFKFWLPLDPVADRDGFAVVYPVAVDGRWSYGRPIIDPMPSRSGRPVDDVGFLRDLIGTLVRDRIADPARIYVTGLSRGGLMSFTAACTMSDLIAAVAPLITGMTEHQRDDCRPQRLVPMMVLAGTNDPVQVYDGWIEQQGRLLSVPETMEFWRRLHGCKGQDERMLPHRDPADPTHVEVIDWLDCRAGAPLRLYRVHGGGHRIPKLSEDRRQDEDNGVRSRDLDTPTEIWAFFKDYRR